MNQIPNKPTDAQWTDNQWKSIYAKGQDILVAAAAGSGKTAVLVERIIQRIITDGIDVDRLLVVTFTNASAREMKARVEQRIKEASYDDPNNTHLKNQRIKIHQAQISTLHSFCLKLIQQHYDVLDIDPNFRTSSEAENILLLEQTIDEVLETHYDQLDPHFVDLTEQLSSDRNDEAFRNMIKQMYYFSIANPSPRTWLQSLSYPYENDDAQQQYLTLLNDLAMIFITSAQEALNKSYDLFMMLEAVDKQVAVIDQERRFMAEVIEGGQLNTEQLVNHQFEARFPAKNKAIKEANEMMIDVYDDAKKYYDQYKAFVTKVKEDYFARSASDLTAEMKKLAPRVEYLATITTDVIEQFNHKKRSRNLVDFSDYEHFALQILMNEDGTISEIAQNLSDQIYEILVDEYQDTNRVQEKILSCIKKGDAHNGNLFMVGDVKQSIYKFRQADPSLFIEKYNDFSLDGSSSGLRIDLSQNFRSRPGVLHTTNYLFDHMMDEAVGEIVYDQAARLYNGAPYDDQPMPLQLNTLVEDAQSGLTGTEQEAEYIVQQVQTIMNEREVYDMKTQSYRKPSYKDIVILERTYGQARRLQQAFKDHDIPFHVNSKEGYFEQTEVRLILSFLRTVDNPLQDIYLVGLMRSVIYQFTEVELSNIRVFSPNDDYFYQSIEQYMKHELANKTLVKKLQRFMDDIAAYQIYSQHHPVYQLIDKFYNDHFVIQYFSGLIGGKGRRANLYGLFNKAVEFENTSFRGLYQFIRFIDELIERGKDFGEENVIGPNDDVVRMMTVHSSKGLEFPFVIYSGLSKQFRKNDLTKQIILNQQYGIGMQYFDVATNITFPSLASVTIKAIAEKELISEEMRLIYVALTRAKEQLFLIGRVKDEADLDKLIQTVVSDNHLPVSYRLTAQRPIELIYPILAKYQSSELPRELRFENQITDLPVELQPRVTLNVDHYEDIANETEHSTNSARSVTDIVNSEANQEQQQQIYHQLAYEYPYPKDIVKASKQSVSELKRQLETEEAGTNYDRVRQYSIGSAAYERPAFLAQNVKRRANEIGTLMHTVMQHLPFQEGGLTESELDQYLDQLVAKNIIAEADKNDVNIGEIIQFTHSELYNTITHSDYIFRELPFIVNQSKVDQNFDEDEDISIIQGMIDLIFVKDNQYYFVDYKTDAFNRRRGMTDQEIGEQLRQRYKIQMTYYQKTLETILDKQVKGYLYFFKYGQLSIED
ncbi:helicase-exonuclease AddAB subunit AddA [Staphylococcus arlettae]|uniref:helicase-exonuclease AddAB subunit AddA n=2 Tax=Staphylococcus arlettae TaxID=29378 RepID=UPI0010721215|nr:helicase-exonuclease AddAB subunit AddA [Staphylococcus arlettae]MBF0737253.1 helicase-exonuclease AddAB subunit AddA [Staphylococcus arlettae]TFU48028.1 helicase-exonuclease AddAB subunit AddA [Staphylococcus arlettae]